MTTSFVRRRSTLGVVCGALVLLAGCSDLPSRPTPNGPAVPGPAMRDASDSPDGGSILLRVAGEAPLQSSEKIVAVFPERTIVQMDAAQAFAIDRVDGTPGAGFLGLGGRQSALYGCSHQGEARLRADEGGWGGCSLADPYAPAHTDTVAVQGTVMWGYSFDAACPYPDYGCAMYRGSSSVSLRRLDAQLSVKVDPDTIPLASAPAGHAFTFRASVTPSRMGVYDTPVSFVDGWTFTPSAGADSGVTHPLACAGAQLACTIPVWESGAVALDARVNGIRTTHGPIAIHVRDGPQVRVVQVTGRTLGGSFTTLRSERRIDLYGETYPEALAAGIRWDVTDLETDGVDSPLPVTVRDGANSSFTIPVVQLDRWRWPKEHSKDVGNLSRRALAYRVVASVTANGVATRSAPATISQNETDTMRQEYIDLAVPQEIIPPWRSIAPPREKNDGDYSLTVVNPNFDGLVDRLRSAWRGGDFIVNGYFRNPVHNAFHVNKGKSSGTVSASWHQYGCGADLQTLPRVDESSPAVLRAAARAFWDGLAAEARSIGFRVEPRDPDPTKPGHPYSGVGHVHIEIRCNE